MGDDIDIRNSYAQTGEAAGGLQSTHLSAGGKPLMEVGADGAMHFNTPTAASTSPAAAPPTTTAPASLGNAQELPSIMVPTPPRAPDVTAAGAGPTSGTTSAYNPSQAYPSVQPQAVSSLQAQTLPEMNPIDASGSGGYPTVTAEQGIRAAGDVESQRGEGTQLSAASDVEAVPPTHGMGYAPFAERKQ